MGAPSFPLDAVRRDTPGVRVVVHLNNAGSSLPPEPVVDTVVGHLRREAAIGGYEAAAEAGERLAGVYRSVARLIGASPDEVAIVENATRAWDMAVYAYPFERGARVLTSRAEYASNALAFLQLRDRVGLDLVLIEDDGVGQISLDHLEDELRRGAAMVALTHVPTSGGLVNPAQAVGQLCRRYGAFYVLDACQSVGQLPIDVETFGCDVLSATGRKFLRGPRGTGLLYVRRDQVARLDPPFIDLHAAQWTSATTYRIRDDARRFENWETNVAAKLGLGAAADYALALGVERTWPVIRSLAADVRTRLAQIPGVVVHDKGIERAGIVTFTVDGSDAEDVARLLAEHRINTSVSKAEYAQFDLGARGLRTVVRASVHYYNSSDEIDRLLEVLTP